jgi:hypothetical protein
MHRSGATRARHALVGVTALMLALMPIAARAEAPPEAIMTIQNQEPSLDIEHWWGGVGAVICGIEIRLMIKAPVIGFNPYAIAAGIAGCCLAALDIMSTT